MSGPGERARRQLHALARSKGIEVRWRAQDGSMQTCSDDTLLAILQLLRVDVRRPEDARRARADLRRDRGHAVLDPVVVAWDGRPPVVPVRVPGSAGADFALVVETESGTHVRWTRRELRVRPVAPASAETAEELLVELPRGFEPGRHHVRFEATDRTTATTSTGTSATLISAPTRLRRTTGERAWGVFAPVYALHAHPASGAGDLGALERFAQWIAPRGGTVVGTLPILAMFAGHAKEPCDPSPYAPVSRRYWNELYLDLAALPELAGVAGLPDAPPDRALDLPALAAARRPFLETATARAQAAPGRRAELAAWLAAHPDAGAYAEFRAATEGSGRDGAAYHEYVQWALSGQLARLARAFADRGQVLYIDLPVGTHRGGYDVATRPGLFATAASVGAPPDSFQPTGQDWGFPPLDPDAARADGHGYLTACLDEQLRYARMLRVDHVMGLHRLWMIPAGAPATEGAYVHYPADEHWATICLVAARHDATIVGENLGTVPPATNRAMRRHRALGIWVAQFELPDHADAAAPAPGSGVLACLDTHDLATFATWWHDLQPGPRGALLNALRASGDLDSGAGEVPSPHEVLTATLAWLGRSRAPVVLASLEDLWLEPDPQNIPGDGHQDASFRQRAAYSVDELETLISVTDALDQLDQARRSAV